MRDLASTVPDRLVSESRVGVPELFTFKSLLRVFIQYLAY